MRRRTSMLVLVGAIAAWAGATAGARAHWLRMLPTETRVVPPLADPALVPGIARCTSDGRCTVTDERGTHAGTPLVLAPRS